MPDEQYIPTPQEVGHKICGNLIFSNYEGMSLALHALLYIVGVSSSDVAKMTGLSRSRIGQYGGRCVPVPAHRAYQFHYILKGVVESFEENLSALKKDPKSFKAALVKGAVPAAQSIVAVCRGVLEAEKKAGWI